MTETTLPPFEESVQGKPRMWLKGYARRVAPSSISPDDLESEGMIAMWQAYQKIDKPGDNVDSYLIQAAKWQILRVLERRQWTGQNKTPAARGSNSKGGIIHADQAEQYYPDDVMKEWEATSTEEPGYEVADISDIRAQVREAVAGLKPSQRDRIFRKFWLDESVWLSGKWWSDARYGARAALTERLGHLHAAN